MLSVCFSQCYDTWRQESKSSLLVLLHKELVLVLEEGHVCLLRFGFCGIDCH